MASSALQFEYAEGPRQPIINLVDTPGHADFSEDTYRVLTAVDAAVMLIDAARASSPRPSSSSACKAAACRSSR